MGDKVFVIFIFFGIFFKECLTSTFGPKDPFLTNFITDEGIEDAECDRMGREIEKNIRETHIENPPRLAGKWVSEGCEVRSGPEYLLRSYTFLKNNSFKLLQFHYGDESCTLPTYTIIARGHYKLQGMSWVIPGGTEAEYSLTRVTVVAQTAEAAEALSNKVNSTCLGNLRRTWRPYKEYVIYHLQDIDEFNEDNSNSYKSNHYPSHHRWKKTSMKFLVNDVDCQEYLNVAFHELQLMRVQKRPRGALNDEPRVELLLGDIHSRTEARTTYRPTAFQIPLVKVDQNHACNECHVVARGTEKSPPHLFAKPKLPPYLDGTWLSETCEVRPFGLFLQRRLSFDSRDHSWSGVYQFYVDPACTVPSFTISASGRYSPGMSKSWGHHVEGGSEFDFKVDQAYLTLLETSMVNNLNADHRCGNGVWMLGVAKDLTPTRGCSSLGVVIPTTEYELIRIEINAYGTPLLLLGQPDTENRRRGPSERPTSYQAPLVQCQALPNAISPVGNSLFPVSYARVGARSEASSANSELLFYFLVKLYIIHYF